MPPEESRSSSWTTLRNNAYTDWVSSDPQAYINYVGVDPAIRSIETEPQPCPEQPEVPDMPSHVPCASDITEEMLNEWIANGVSHQPHGYRFSAPFGVVNLTLEQINDIRGRSAYARDNALVDRWSTPNPVLSYDDAPTTAGLSMPTQARQAIHNYTYQPSLRFKHGRSEENADYYFGIEIEAEVPRDQDRHEVATSVAGKSKVIYCKDDSSIGHGFEMVTHPMSWEYVKQSIRGDGAVSKTLNRAIAAGMESYSTQTCGMHVHVSQTAFSGTIHLYKFLRLIYSNKRFTKRIARRAGSRVDEWASLETGGMTLEQMADEKRSISRHVAVNLNPRETFEIRVFRGTLEKDGVMMNIGFVRSLIEYTRNATLEDYSLKGYKRYVRDNASEYRELYLKI